MKLLWVNTNYLHPTNRGGQIRTLEILRRLHRRHEIHYVTFADEGNHEGIARSHEYCSKIYPIPLHVAEKTSPKFALQLAAGLFSSLPLALSRWSSTEMRKTIEGVLRAEHFDSRVADFLIATLNTPDLASWVLFQHNVEAVIWKRREEHASNPLERAYIGLQARRMATYEGEVCRKVRRVIAVSEADAVTMQEHYGVSKVYATPTGVDVEYFSPPTQSPKTAADLIFVGSMDWMPNTDGILWFVREVLPLIRRRRPECKLAIVGRKPSKEIQDLPQSDPGILVTGTVPDVRPWLFGGRVSVVPLRIGGGTRLKIYEAMAAGLPVVSTTVGAEGLDVLDGETIHLADQPEDFAQRCLRLLESEEEHQRMADAARDLVVTRCSWEAVSRQFEELLR